MIINNLQYGYGTEVNNKITLNIYFSGCHNNKRCEREKCQNKNLHRFNNGTQWHEWIPEITNIITQKNFVEGICLLGGEPFDQNISEMIQLLSYIKSLKALPIYCYTGYENFNDKQIENYKKIFDGGLFAGPYIENEPEAQGWLWLDQDDKIIFGEERKNIILNRYNV